MKKLYFMILGLVIGVCSGAEEFAPEVQAFHAWMQGDVLPLTLRTALRVQQALKCTPGVTGDEVKDLREALWRDGITTLADNIHDPRVQALEARMGFVVKEFKDAWRISEYLKQYDQGMVERVDEIFSSNPLKFVEVMARVFGRESVTLDPSISTYDGKVLYRGFELHEVCTDEVRKLVEYVVVGSGKAPVFGPASSGSNPGAPV
jgi:hypothetical protein